MISNITKQKRLVDKLQHELGEVILSYLADPDILEVMLNPDGLIWARHYQKGCLHRQETMDASTAQLLIGSVAHHCGLVVNEQNPTLETELPPSGYRFSAAVPPNVIAPSFVIRKAADTIYSLEDYVKHGFLTAQDVQTIHCLIHANKTMLISGGPGCGKTTFANAILHEMMLLGEPNQRFIVVEDTRELQCSALNKVNFKTSEFANYERFLKLTLRFSPDRIIVGECRGEEALTLLKAWNTGTGGGIATLHANSADSALQRIQDMAQESGSTPSPYLICESVQSIISLGFNDNGRRRLQQIVEVVGYKDGK